MPASPYELDASTVAAGKARADALDRDQPVLPPTPPTATKQQGGITTASGDRPAGFDPQCSPVTASPIGRSER